MIIAALDRKLLRDLLAIKGQAFAIAMVMAAGVAMFILMFSTLDSLQLTRRVYYERQRFGDVFASCKRAPDWLRQEIARIPGVAQVQTRIVTDVILDVSGFTEPVTGRLISVPDEGRPLLCDVFLRAGRYPEPGRSYEVMAGEGFVNAHGMHPGETIVALLNGRRQPLRLVGVALSPEYIYSIPPGSLFPDEARFGVFWMEHRALAAAFDMLGGFNDVVLKLDAGASESDVIRRLDALLAPYGGLGAIPRRLQTSNWYLDAELLQLKNTGSMVPLVFLAVAAFLLNVVMSRTVSVQREQIACLKAVGYGNRDVALHYIKWSLLISLAGAIMGLIMGAWLGSGMTRLYTEFFHFPILLYRLNRTLMVQAALISVAAGVLGGLFAVRRAVKLPPAEALRPEAPARYRVSAVERSGLGNLMSQPTRIVFRTLERHPGRIFFSVAGIAMACALLVVGAFFSDSINQVIEVQFNLAQRYDVMVTFVEPASGRASYETRRLPGILAGEVFRNVPARLRLAQRSRLVPLAGLPQQPELNRVLDIHGRPVKLPAGGLVLSSKLGEVLGAGLGDQITVEVLEGARTVYSVPVVGLIEEYMGIGAYMEIGSLHRLLREGPSLSGTYLAVDSRHLAELHAALKRMPRVAGVTIKRAAIESFRKTFAEMMGQIQAVNVFFAAVIAFGVVFNTARVSLAERSRELATLRVIGYTRAEISYILLGELAIVTALAIPLGLAAGYGFAGLVVASLDTEVYRMPLVVSPRTYAFAAATVATATALSAMLVRRRLDRLRLVEVLKTRE